MSTTELLAAVKAAGIVLAAAGDRLTYNAPKGAMTSALRETLTRHKPEILAALQPAKYVTLRPDSRTGFAPTIRAEALVLVLDLERRGFTQTIDSEHRYQVEPRAGLTDADRVAIARWRHQLVIIVGYEPPEVS
ncbi:MAG TPA: hypothetical protein VNJ04_21355 [Gemmatimonadaceae bacterium]|nr:hypothetical protein [Gemmatimonadaceae bacterium]